MRIPSFLLSLVDGGNTKAIKNARHARDRDLPAHRRIDRLAHGLTPADSRQRHPTATPVHAAD